MHIAGRIGGDVELSVAGGTTEPSSPLARFLPPLPEGFHELPEIPYGLSITPDARVVVSLPRVTDSTHVPPSHPIPSFTNFFSAPGFLTLICESAMISVSFARVADVAPRAKGAWIDRGYFIV